MIFKYYSIFKFNYVHTPILKQQVVGMPYYISFYLSSINLKASHSSRITLYLDDIKNYNYCLFGYINMNNIEVWVL